MLAHLKTPSEVDVAWSYLNVLGSIRFCCIPILPQSFFTMKVSEVNSETLHSPKSLTHSVLQGVSNRQRVTLGLLSMLHSSKMDCVRKTGGRPRDQVADGPVA